MMKFTHKFAFLTAISLFCGTTVFADDVEMTSYIQNPSFESQTDGWTVTSMDLQNNTHFTMKSGNVYLQRWVARGSQAGTCSATQKLSYMPAGHYRLTAAAQNIQQNSETDAQTGVSIYAGTTTNATTVTVVSDYSVTYDCDGSPFTIGFRAVSATGNYLCVDNFRLYYTGADLTLLQTASTNAQAIITMSEKSAYAGLQPAVKTALEAQIAAVQAFTEETTADALQETAFALAPAAKAAEENMNALKALKTLINKSKTLLTRDMPVTYITALQAVYDEGVTLLTLTTDDDPVALTERLQAAYDAANDSYTAKKALNVSINNANVVLRRDNLVGREALQAVLDEALALMEKEDATTEEMTAMKSKLDDATLLCRFNNPTSTTAVNVKTLSVIEGATTMFGRASFSGATAKEQGFCWSESPEPTVFDNHSTTYYNNQGASGVIYYMENVKPSTVYYVRAYAYTSGYRLTYGEVFKVATRPMGTVTYGYDNAGSEAENARIIAACDEAVWMWNNVGGVRDFYLDAHYVPGAGAEGGTADCKYGGYMRISQTASYQRTGTVLHEGSHGLGVIGWASYSDDHCNWHSNIYRTNYSRGEWLGPRVDRVVQFLEDNPSAQLHGDYQHMWPYGINGADEDTGQPMLYRGNALVIAALFEDGLREKTVNFARPAYTFVQDDDTKYYIKSEDESCGLTTSYLRQTTTSAIRFAEATADEVFDNDSCAWYIAYNPKTSYYTFKNAATGRYMNLSASTLYASASATAFQLLGSRQQTSVGDYTFAGSSYWLVNSSTLSALNATSLGGATATFDHSNSATTQRWLLLTGDEVASFAQAQGETVGIGSVSRSSAQPNIQARGGHGFLYITAIGGGQNVDVYALDGRLVKRVYVQLDATARISVPRGMYIVGGQKVLVR